ncbi:MAG: hypothetical protein A2V90_07180 [Gammaproteobacteria bacterium RBG_16_57_12]|nr:MAG: hypothetical protein A2V90_07180 [Gammaproteobacteria bacterium RBG_16_57_12]
MRKILTAAALFTLFTHVYAAGDPATGEEKSATCQGCHGADGNSPSADFPSLAGQNATYIIKQLQNFKEGKRSNETMSAMAATLEDQDMADIAAYFSSKKGVSTGSSAPKEVLNRGRLLYKGGNKKEGMAACAGCHGAKGTGNGPAGFPALAGQHADYIERQLLAFKTEERKNDMNHMMRDISFKLTSNDMKAVAAYLTTLTP